ncbi:MAG: hypothetical protein ACRDV9_00190 [Acidimicrobiia bacterium]
MGDTGDRGLGAIRLSEGDGTERPISTYFGRPLIIVCIRYYG